MSHAGLGCLAPEPTVGRGARPPLALAATPAEPQARDDPTLLFKAIWLLQCTGKALFDLNVKFYSFFKKKKFFFLSWRSKKGRVVLNV